MESVFFHKSDVQLAHNHVILFMLFLEIDPALVVDINFIKQNHDKLIDLTTSTPTVRRTQIVQQHDVNTDSLYHAPYEILPGAYQYLFSNQNQGQQQPHTVLNQIHLTSHNTEVTNTLSGNEAGTDEDQAESSYSEPNQSCAVTQTTDAISGLNHTVDVIPAPLTSFYHENMSDYQLKKEAERVFYSMEISDREFKRPLLHSIALCSGEISEVDA